VEKEVFLDSGQRAKAMRSMLKAKEQRKCEATCALGRRKAVPE
jgi:hypothetical protein